MTYISTLLDRLHAINQTITFNGLTAYRYYPSRAGKLPYIVPLLIGNTAYEQFGTMHSGDEPVIVEARDVSILVAVAPLASDVALQTAHKNAETVIPLVVEAYTTRPYLQLNDNGLTDIRMARITSDTGIDVNPQATDVLSILFTLNVEFLREF